MTLTESIDIDAPIDRVWSVLVDLPAYAQWNLFTYRVDGPAEEGARVVLHVDLGGMKTRQNMAVVSVSPPRELAWSIRGTPRWMMRGQRTQTLTDLGGGRTRYDNQEVVEGAVAPLVALFFAGRIQAGLVAVSQALKARCESPAT